MFYVYAALTHCIANCAIVKWKQRCCHNCRCRPLLLNHVALAEQETHSKVNSLASPADIMQA